ncbi:hypothetical protein [Lacrimispora sp. 38-1]|uniref:hypothetical protein n=1 Tax=Lacrimispora sp. 38-1 TaxID=3125778 RepID=UPI003CFB9B22
MASRIIASCSKASPVCSSYLLCAVHNIIITVVVTVTITITIAAAIIVAITTTIISTTPEASHKNILLFLVVLYYMVQ